MMLRVIFIFFLGLISLVQVARTQVVLTNNSLSGNFTKQVRFLEDKAHAYGIDDVVKLPGSEFKKMPCANQKVQFTSARFWLKFEIINQTNHQNFIIETARPVTDVAKLYRVNAEGELIAEQLNGDNFKYSQKDIPHRKILFPIQLQKGESQLFYLAIEGGGEGLAFPVKIHEEKIFYQDDYKLQFTNGFYYGVIVFVIIIYFFFFLLLKNKSFLYYILYVFFQGLLQFSLDGYAFHHFFPDNPYLLNRFPLITGALATFFMLVYVSNYVGLPAKNKTLYQLFRVACISVVISLLFSFIPGALNALSFPLVNAVSLLSILMAVFAIYYLRFTKHTVDNYFTLAFTVLIVGAAIFIVGNFGYISNANITLNALKVCSVLEVVILSISMSYKYRELQKDKELAQAIALKNLKEKNEAMDEINVRLEEQVLVRTSQIEKQRSELAYKNNEILGSIKYAKRIQEAILPSNEQVVRLLPRSFIFYLPKDVVSGDFYFVENKPIGDQYFTVFSAIDCTGHGVPGAFMSIVGNNFLKQAISEKSVVNPAQILDYLNKGVTESLQQNLQGELVRDGMDMSLCMLNADKTELQFAGAKNPLYIIRAKDVVKKTGVSLGEIKDENELFVLYEVKGDKQPIGNHSGAELLPFNNHIIKLLPGDHVYLFTDGFADQFGGPNHKKFNYKRFRSLLLSNASKNMADQKSILVKSFTEWAGENEQIDDVLIVGISV